MNNYSQSTKERVSAGIARRYRRERTFRMAGLGAVLTGMAFLAFFFSTLIGNGYTAFLQTHILLDVELSAAVIDPDGAPRPAKPRASGLPGPDQEQPESPFPRGRDAETN